MVQQFLLQEQCCLECLTDTVQLERVKSWFLYCCLVFLSRHDISNQIPSKTKQECEQHYTRIFVENAKPPFPSKYTNIYVTIYHRSTEVSLYMYLVKQTVCMNTTQQLVHVSG